MPPVAQNENNREGISFRFLVLPSISMILCHDNECHPFSKAAPNAPAAHVSASVIQPYHTFLHVQIQLKSFFYMYIHDARIPSSHLSYMSPSLCTIWVSTLTWLKDFPSS